MFCKNRTCIYLIKNGSVKIIVDFCIIWIGDGIDMSEKVQKYEFSEDKILA